MSVRVSDDFKRGMKFTTNKDKYYFKNITFIDKTDTSSKKDNSVSRAWKSTGIRLNRAILEAERKLNEQNIK